jgi:hypothetical protein
MDIPHPGRAKNQVIHLILGTDMQKNDKDTIRLTTTVAGAG